MARYIRAIVVYMAKKGEQVCSGAPYSESGWWYVSRAPNYTVTRARGKTAGEACGGSFAGVTIVTKCSTAGTAINQSERDKRIARANVQLAKQLSSIDPMTMTCWMCHLETTCPSAWDLYNTDGDCLESK
jgi:hypothetical protein